MANNASTIIGLIGAYFFGPIGYAVGSLIGNIISPEKGPNIVGPRLDDLSAQTSSNIADLPRTYGTMGHYGNMIWALNNQITEVVDVSTKKKKVLGFTVAKQEITTYTYYLTCAVAFCRVPEDGVVTVLRIWMGDTLVYNISSTDVGTIQSSSAFSEQITIYPGTDDQPVDPTIAADVGEENASAYPGIFYIVLRDFELTDYLNSVSRAQMKVEYSLTADTDGGIEFIGQSAAYLDAEYPGLHNANFFDIDGMHVWATGPADEDGLATTFTKLHYLAVPGTDFFIQSQTVSNAIPQHLISDVEFASLNRPAKGRADTNAQVFTAAFMRELGPDAGEPNLDPRFYQGVAVLRLHGLGWGVANGIYNSIVGTSDPSAPTSGFTSNWSFPSFGQALQSIRVVTGGPGMLASQPTFDDYSFNPDNQHLQANGVLWADLVGFDPRYTIEMVGSFYEPLPFPITEEVMAEDVVHQQWISAIVVAPGYTQEHRIGLSDGATLPTPDTFFSALGDDVFFGFIIGDVSHVVKLGNTAYTAIASISSPSPVELLRMGFVGESLHVLMNTGSGLMINIYDLDLVLQDSLDATEINSAFGANDAELAETLSFDFSRFLWLDGGDLYRKNSLASPSVLVGDVSADIIDGSDYPAFFGMTINGAILAVPTVGGDMPDTGVQFFTINLVATVGKVLLADILRAECILAGVPDENIDTSLILDEVTGYRITQRGSVRNVIQQLQLCYPFDALQSGYFLKFVPRGQTPIASVTYGDLAPDVQWRQEREMTSQLPRRVIFRYLERETEYEIAEQYSERPLDSEKESIIDVPIVFTPDEAAQVVDVLHSIYVFERESYGPFDLPPTYRMLEPSDVITVQVSNGTIYQVRLTSVEYRPDGSTVCSGARNAVAIYSSDAVGASSTPAETEIPIAASAITEVMDTPVNIIETSPGITAAMGSPADNWKGGTLIRLIGNNWTEVQGFTDTAPIGVALDELDEHGGHLPDLGSTLTIRLSVGEIESTDEDGLYNEVLMAAYGVNGRWEMISVQNVTDNLDGTLTLDTFLRGLRGTEWSTGLHAPGDVIVFLNFPGVEFVELETSDIGELLTFRGISKGRDINSQFDETLTYTGENLRPLSPVNASAAMSIDDIVISWDRRDRVDAGWENFNEIPMSESVESFEIDIYNDTDEVVRTLTTNTESVTYTEAEQIEDFGEAIDGAFTLSIYQMSSVVGRGRPLTDTITPSGIVPTDPFFASVVLLCGFEGTNGSTTMLDQSSYARALTAVGNAQLTTTTPLMGVSSLLLDGTGDTVTSPTVANLTVGTQDFTIECFIRFNTVTGSQDILSQWGGSASSTNRTMVFYYTANTLRFTYNQVFTQQVAWTPITNTTYFVVVCRAAGVLRFFVDGVQVGANQANVTNLAVPATILRIGASGDASNVNTNFVNGRIDELRYTIGVGRYTANFTPPAVPFPRS